MTEPGGALVANFSYRDRVVIVLPDGGTGIPNIDGLEAALGAMTATLSAQDVVIAGLQADVTALSVWTPPPEYADNAAALAGGLAVGDAYHTAAGEGRIVVAPGTPTGGGTPSTPAPFGTQFISTYDPVNDSNSYSAYFEAANPADPKGGTAVDLWYKNAKRITDLTFQPWCISSTDDNIVRFEVRPGDQFNVPGFYTDSAGVQRNKITEASADWHAPTEDLRYDFQIKVEGPPITSNFFALLEIHTYGAGVIAQKFELIIRNEHFAVTANADVVTNGTPAYRDLWPIGSDVPMPVVRGQWYPVTIFVRSNRSGTPAGRVVVDINNTRVVNFTGRTGYANETNASVEFGIYRGTSSPETIVVSYKDWVQVSGAYNTLAIPTAPAGTAPTTTYGPDLFSGAGTFDTAVAPWTATDSAVLASVSGELRVTTAGGVFTGPPSARYQIDTMEVGASYRLQGTQRKGTGAAGSSEVLAYNAAFTTTYADVTNSTTTNTDVDVTFVADNTTAIIFLARKSATANGDSAFFDNFTLRKVL